MKKLTFLTLTLVFTSFISKSQDLNLRGGLNFATQSELLGIQLGVNYPITTEIDLAGGFTFYFPEKTEFTNPFDGSTTTIKSGLWMLDVDGHYNFPMEAVTVYPLVGLNLSNFTVSTNGNGNTSSFLGLNVGGGISFGLSESLDGFAEIKYIIGEADQAVLGAGVKFGI